MNTKPKLAIATALAVACSALFGGGQDTPKTILARLEWTVTTNWAAAYQTRTLMGWTGDKDPNVTTYHENGTIQSNLVAYVEWKGKVSSVVIETIYVGTVNRSYTLSEPTRVYR
jgi:hypothetical protein